jgi:hypothetical protein
MPANILTSVCTDTPSPTLPVTVFPNNFRRTAGLFPSYDILRIKVPLLAGNVAPEFIFFLPFIPNTTCEYNG